MKIKELIEEKDNLYYGLKRIWDSEDGCLDWSIIENALIQSKKKGIKQGAKAKEEEIVEMIDKNFHIVNNQGKDKPYKRIQISLPKWEKLKQKLIKDIEK